VSTDTVTTVKSLAPVARGGPLQSVTDSLTIAKRNLIRMSRIPNLVGRAWSGSTWSDPINEHATGLTTTRGWAQ
jgi:hypothetical protein